MTIAQAAQERHYDPEFEHSFQIAAKPILRRIRNDCKSAPPSVQPLLKYLEDHVFEHDTDVNQLKRACDVRDNCVPIDFHNAVHLPPHAYIEDCRLEVAATLLTTTKTRIWQIGQAVGYLNLQTFSRAFARWSGVRPSEFRRERRIFTTERSQKRRGRKTDLSQNVAKRRNKKRKKLFLGEQGPDQEATRGQQQSEAHLPETQLPETAAQEAQAANNTDTNPSVFAALLNTSVTARRAEDILAEDVWEDLVESEFKDDGPIVRTVFKSTALFDLLRVKSREEGRGNRELGVRIAKLALHSVEMTPSSVDETVRKNRLAHAMAWLANAHRLALDQLAASEAIARAEKTLPSKNIDPRVLGDILHIKSAICWYQRRLSEALTHVDHGIAALRRQNEKKPLARSLIQRAILYERTGAAPHAQSDFEEVILLAQEIQDEYLLLNAYQGLGVIYKAAGRHLDAQKILEALKPLCLKYDQEYTWAFYWWLDAGIRQGLGEDQAAERCFLQAREMLVQLNDAGNASVAGLELAMLYLRRDRVEEAAQTVTEVLPLLKTLQVHPEALVASQILQTAVQKKTLSQMTLLQVGRKLDTALRSR